MCARKALRFPGSIATMRVGKLVEMTHYCNHVETICHPNSSYTPVTLYRDYTELARRCEISQSAVGSPKNAENRCILFSIFTPWRCYGVPTAIVPFLLRFHGVFSRSCGVLVGDRLRAHGVLMACPRRSTACHGVHTAF